MGRDEYSIFSEGKIGNIRLKNRLVRSSTVEGIFWTRKVTVEVLNFYKELSEGGVGLIIAGNTPAAENPRVDTNGKISYDEFEIEGLERIAEIVHGSATGCKVVKQVGGELWGVAASAYPTKFPKRKQREVSKEEIRMIENRFVREISKLKEDGFNGVQLHGAHGYFLCSFLSPYMNRRTDEYGGSVRNRVRIVREIVSKARDKIDDFPILIKVNCTDNVEGGTDINTFLEIAREIEDTGVDAIEVSGGITECLIRTEEELGFRPVPSPSAHTRINKLEKQSYYLKYAESLDLSIPVILVGGNRDIERLEKIIRQGKVDYIALSRPFISEPDLPNRWKEGRDSSTTECISCNSCFYPIFGPDGPIGYTVPICLFKHDKQNYKMTQEWLPSWVEHNVQK
jgi:2,4-dienoyl-CoA reductase-like NADH-dependent reductase (Old Yellow Enzyme family)